jgi:GT2 family glycosyltransferase
MVNSNNELKLPYKLRVHTFSLTNKDARFDLSITIPTKDVNSETFKRAFRSIESTSNELLCNIYIQAVESSGTEFNFARSVNTGFAERSADYFLNMNDDVELYPGTLKTSLERSKSLNDKVLLGALLYFPSGRIQHAGMQAIMSNTFRYYSYHILKYKAPLDAMRKKAFFREHGYKRFVFFIHPDRIIPDMKGVVTGAYHFMSAQTLNLLKCYDESYSNGSEDADLCLSAIQGNVKVAIDASIQGTHYEGRSFSTGYNESRREGLLHLNEKWGMQRILSLIEANGPIWLNNVKAAHKN